MRHMTNDELFQLYDSDLMLRLHNVKNLSDTRKILTKFKQTLNDFPPSPELAKGFCHSMLTENREHYTATFRC
ncbi:hypothetical protein ACFLVG_05325 [Chloroflexota bacterium]